MPCNVHLMTLLLPCSKLCWCATLKKDKEKWRCSILFNHHMILPVHNSVWSNIFMYNIQVQSSIGSVRVSSLSLWTLGTTTLLPPLKLRWQATPYWLHSVTMETMISWLKHSLLPTGFQTSRVLLADFHPLRFDGLSLSAFPLILHGIFLCLWSFFYSSFFFLWFFLVVFPAYFSNLSPFSREHNFVGFN